MATDTLTPTIESTTAAMPSIAPLRPHRVTVEEYWRMAEARVFGPEPKLELIEGVIVEKMTKSTPHILVTDLIQELLGRIKLAGTYVSMGNPITIIERQSEPEPDAMIVRGSPRDYREKRVTPADVLLVVQAAHTSIDADRGPKLSLYAAAGIPMYWIVNVPSRSLEIYSHPGMLGACGYYAVTRTFTESQDAPLEIDGNEIARFPVREILP